MNLKVYLSDLKFKGEVSEKLSHSIQRLVTGAVKKRIQESSEFIAITDQIKDEVICDLRDDFKEFRKIVKG